MRHALTMTRCLPTILVLLSLSSCGTDGCRLPQNWVLATSLKASPVPYTPKTVFYAKEVRPASWLWGSATVSDERFLEEVAVATSLHPQPVLLFKFADGHSCTELNRKREKIAQAARCSVDGIPCIQGTMAEYRAAAGEAP